MMFWISPLLAVISLVTRAGLGRSSPWSSPSARRSSSRCSGSARAISTGTWRRCSPATTSSRSSVARRRPSSVFDEQNEGLYEASFKAQFISGIIMPVMMFVSNLQLRGGRVSGRAAGGQRHHVAGRRAGLHPVRPAVRPAHRPDRERGQRAAVGRGLGRAGVRDAGRGGGVGRARRSRSCSRRSTGHIVSTTSRSATCPTRRSSSI